MNERDSEFIAGLFIEKGYRLVAGPKDADIILFNTCTVRKHAEERAISNMGALLKSPVDGPRSTDKRKIYGIIGCTAQAMGEELFNRLPGLNIICGTGEIARLPELVEKAHKSRVKALENIDEPLPEINPGNPGYRKDKKHAYVSIMRGCNNFCSYCIVPYVRGRERSRKVGDIVKEAESLAARDISDITLLGQNVNSYSGLDEIASPLSADRNDGELHNDEIASSGRNFGPARNDGQLCDFVSLLRKLNRIKGIKRIHFMTSHPKDATVRLFEVMRDSDKVVKHLHLPFQSGSDSILRLMKRGYTREKYLALVEKARKIVPGLRLTTDIIVGFPGESAGDFNDTLRVLKKVKFDLAYIFKYSPRPGTKAAELKDDVPEEVKKKRHKILLDAQKNISNRKKDAKVHNFSFC